MISKIRRPGLRGIFDFEMLPMPQFPPLDFPLDAGSGGADGGGEPAPAPSPGDDMDVFVAPPPVYAFPVVQEPTARAVPASEVAASPNWLLIGGGALAGLLIGALVLRG